MVSVPSTGSSAEKPDQIVPMLAPHRLIGEIRLWRGHTPLPPANGILLQNFAEQGALAIERVQAAEAELAIRDRSRMPAQSSSCHGRTGLRAISVG